MTLFNEYRPRPDMGAVSRMLALRIDSLAPEIFPNAKRVGSEWLVGSVAGEHGKSLAIHTGGVKAGVWSDFSAGQKGDALELIAQVLYRGDRRKALRWAMQWLGLDEYSPADAPLRPVPVRQQTSREVREADSSIYWRQILRESTAANGTLVERYLNGRGLSLPPYASLLFHPACPLGSKRYPAMVAVMTDAVTNLPVGIHRTFLAPDGSSLASVEKPKMMLGRAGVIRLVEDEDVTMSLGIAEGIETALAIMQRAGWSPIWATGSASGIVSFPVLAGIEALTIFADNDPVNVNGKQPGMDAARVCAETWSAAGKEVYVTYPPLGLDWDDALKVAA